MSEYSGPAGNVSVSSNNECVLSIGGWFHSRPGQCFHVPHYCGFLPLITSTPPPTHHQHQLPPYSLPPPPSKVLIVSIEICACHQLPQSHWLPVCFCCLISSAQWILRAGRYLEMLHQPKCYINHITLFITYTLNWLKSPCDVYKTFEWSVKHYIMQKYLLNECFRLHSDIVACVGYHRR